jgi:hypothetical protein
MISKLKRIPAFLIKFIANLYGYKIGMVKVGNGKTTIEGDIEVLKYFDISGYVFKKEPLKRTK